MSWERNTHDARLTSYEVPTPAGVNVYITHVRGVTALIVTILDVAGIGQASFHLELPHEARTALVDALTTIPTAEDDE